MDNQFEIKSIENNLFELYRAGSIIVLVSGNEYGHAEHQHKLTKEELLKVLAHDLAHGDRITVAEFTKLVEDNIDEYNVFDLAEDDFLYSLDHYNPNDEITMIDLDAKWVEVIQ